MRVWKISDLEKMKWDQKRRDPKPFPGVFPTRWGIKFKYEASLIGHPRTYVKELNYIGKPSKGLAIRISELGRRREGHLIFWEFDRGGLIQSGMWGCPFYRMRNLWAPLMQFYYRGWAADMYPDMMSTWKDTPMVPNRLKLTHNKKTYVVYHPTGDLLLNSQKEMKQWEEGQNFVLG